jgi:fused signal recognition particle receptor
MFEGLKKKFSDFVDGLSGKEKKEEQAQSQAEAAEEKRKEKGAETKAQEEKNKEQQKGPDVTLKTKIKGALLGKVRISERDAEPFLEQLRIALLETDVNYDVAERIVAKLYDNLVGKEVGTQDIKKEIRDEIRNSLMQTLAKNSGIDILERAREKKEKGEGPFKILFLGPNGAGKTTTIAKIAHMLKANGIGCVISASDTFRAAAIEQAAIHAKRLGVDVIKGTYGADPASIAFDAVAYAKAHGIDAVLIDSAGRQETNKSLIEELKKMVRVNKPDLCIFIGEGIAGNSLLEQVKQFDKAAKLDGVILTKLDVDAKGGNTLSILSDTTVPVLYFGTGERYTDLIPYNPQFVVGNIVPD